LGLISQIGKLSGFPGARFFFLPLVYHRRAIRRHEKQQKLPRLGHKSRVGKLLPVKDLKNPVPILNFPLLALARLLNSL
jgi:hypothetical protein